METETDKRLQYICFAGTVVLAICFFLPFTIDITYLEPDGTPAGILGQWFHRPDTPYTTSRVHLWENMVWIVPVVFFLPLVLTISGILTRNELITKFFVYIEPFIAVLVLFCLFVLVVMADFSIFPGTVERAYGGYVALGAGLVYFVVVVIKVFNLIKLKLKEVENEDKVE